MHTDDLNTIPQSSAVGIRQGTASSPLVAQDKIIDTLGGLLEEVGWTVTPLYASASISYPLSFPITPGFVTTPKTPVSCGFHRFLSLDGTNYSPYDPYTETPSSPTPFCHMFALDLTPEGSLDNFVAAINTSGRWSASWVNNTSGPRNIFVVTIISLTPGASLNYTNLIADGAFGVGSSIEGGGWDCTSQEEREPGGSLRTGQYRVKITSYGNINGFHLTRPIHFETFAPLTATSQIFTIDSTTYANFDFTHGGAVFGTGGRGYTMVANPYSFAVYCPEDPTFTNIFFASPYIPTEESFQTAYCVFVSQGFTGSTSNWGNSAVALDGALLSVPGGLAFPRLLAFRKPGTPPLRTPSGAPLITNAWVAMGRNSFDTCSVVGRLWDCALVHDVPGSGAMIGGKQYTTLASQIGDAGVTRSALLFRTEN